MDPKEIRAKQAGRMAMYVLSRHGADLKKLNVGCSRGIIHLSGELYKSGDFEFDVNGINAMCSELKKIAGIKDIIFRLDNWEIDPSLTMIRPREKK